MSAKEVLEDADLCCTGSPSVAAKTALAALDSAGYKLTRPELVERIMFAVDGYRFGEWSLADAGARILKLIEQNPEAAL